MWTYQLCDVIMIRILSKLKIISIVVPINIREVIGERLYDDQFDKRVIDGFCFCAILCIPYAENR